MHLFPAYSDIILTLGKWGTRTGLLIYDYPRKLSHFGSNPHDEIETYTTICQG